MGKGRRPKPTALKVLQGTFEPSRANDQEPQPKAGRPKTPRRLSSEARSHWKGICDHLERLNVLSLEDEPIIEAACHAYAEMRAADRLIRKHGRLLTPPDDSKRSLAANPAVAMSQQWHGAWVRALLALGLTPAARSKVKARPAEDPKGFDF